MMVETRRIKHLFGLLILVVFLTGCDVFGPAKEQAAIFLPPTIAVTTTPVPFITPVSSLVYIAPKSDCTNTLAYLKDLTVADGSIFSAGEKIDKRWLIENQGTCNWDARYSLRFAGGQPMEAPTEQSLVPALAGSQVMIRIIFTAPKEPGKYRSAWQAYTPDSKSFGDPFFIDIEVLPGSTPASDS